MKINSTGVSIRTNSTQSQSIKTSSGGVSSPLMRDQLEFTEVDWESYGGNSALGVSNEANQKLINVLERLLSDILLYGIEIVVRRPRNYGSYIVEASFQAADKKNKTHRIMLPLRGLENGAKFSLSHDQLVSHTAKSDVEVSRKIIYGILPFCVRSDVVKLICVACHEFGHFLSWQSGNHNKELKDGLEMSNTSGVIRYGFEKLFAVYREEALAWNFGRSKLKKYEFQYLEIYDKTRDHSLDTYYQQLQLKNAPVGIHARLSLYHAKKEIQHENNKVDNKK